MKLIFLVLITILINLPFGAYRTKTKKFSLKWFLSIHIPIPFIYLMRIKSGYGLKIIPLMVLAAFTGQLLGGKIIKKRD
ncbi:MULTISPECIES: hypothetical protein [unclassified Candidatus Frackibacter]|uniref:hypothetical protein n=1 Tax=unclassified Candidatus Frackibacter TaxID=2648818 RepID=UPI000795DB2D|nr:MULTISPECIES: hypothetical protein [unclassified Candidatus Frackibacter]KXS44935.1 MAG: hypothetical protein AWU54_639 [Candidatus Frackibacter sp. T328-2]SDB97170.1 hypothetical protein SAMN04515661_10173 [Candidatus Frackibacter sp. WG11]SEM28834.1 hypothetical protein SAMN04488698_10174 [Candidatus Frackibacter sp. WG12]SFL33676.1 hypothetical protein SAMN04488699_10175 [Candidatus Frackibacter sp. WG13]